MLPAVYVVVVMLLSCCICRSSSSGFSSSDQGLRERLRRGFPPTLPPRDVRSGILRLSHEAGRNQRIAAEPQPRVRQVRLNRRSSVAEITAANINGTMSTFGSCSMRFAARNILNSMHQACS